MNYDSEYGEKNPDWHTEDAPIKFFQLSTIIPASDYEHIIDVGCGTGFLTRLIASYYLPKKMTGADISREVIMRASDNDVFKQVEWKNKDISSINERADLIICADIIEHLSDPKFFLRCANEIGSMIAIRVPIEKTILNSILKFFGRNELKRLEEKYGHINHYSQKELNYLLTETGWTINKIKLYPMPKRSSIILEAIRRISIITAVFYPRFSVRVFGGFSLVLCTRSAR